MATQQNSDQDESLTGDGSERPLVRLENIRKRFGRVLALDGVSLEIRENEILAIVGDNGAGKSTLMNVLTGAHRPTDGRVFYKGEEVSFRNPSDARKQGIETVYQDLALMNDLDIATNIFMGEFPTHLALGPIEIIDWGQTYESAREMMEYLDQDVNTKTEVAMLSGGQRQLVAIGRALSFDPELIILDEPTSALSIAGTELVYDNIRRLKKEGHTQVIVSHSIRDVFDLADRIAAMYQGKLVATVETNETTEDAVIGMITSGEV